MIEVNMLNESMIERMHWRDVVDISKEQWLSLLRDKAIITENDLQILQLIYMSDDFMATASHLARLLSMPHHGPLNSQVGRLGKRIVNNLHILPPKQRRGEGSNWWNVPFWGMGTKEGYYWILRPELRDAMRELIANEEMMIDDESPVNEISSSEEIELSNYEHLYEGAKKTIYVNSYERNVKARKLCIKHFGSACTACGFDFEKMYGEMGRGIIHVHHLKPLHEIGESYKVHPIRDLRPVCPNCHAIIHTRNPAYSIDEVKAMLETTGIG